MLLLLVARTPPPSGASSHPPTHRQIKHPTSRKTEVRNFVSPSAVLTLRRSLKKSAVAATTSNSNCQVSPSTHPASLSDNYRRRSTSTYSVAAGIHRDSARTGRPATETMPTFLHERSPSLRVRREKLLEVKELHGEKTQTLRHCNYKPKARLHGVASPHCPDVILTRRANATTTTTRDAYLT